jgi:hypothetical protein
MDPDGQEMTSGGHGVCRYIGYQKKKKKCLNYSQRPFPMQHCNVPILNLHEAAASKTGPASPSDDAQFKPMF